MTADNRTNELNQNETKSGQAFCFTKAQVEAAAKAIADCHNPGMFEKYPENWRVEARAALVAAAGVTPRAESEHEYLLKARALHQTNSGLPSSTVDEDVERCQWEHYDRRTAQTIGRCLSDAVDGAYCFRHLGTLARRVFYAVNVELQPLTYFAGESAFREWGTRADIWAERLIAAGKPPEPLPPHMKGKSNA